MKADAYSAACRELVAKLAQLPAHLIPTGMAVVKEARALYEQRPR